MSNDNSTTNFISCDFETYGVFVLLVYPMAIIVVITLAVMNNRLQCCSSKGNRPRCIYPINMLDGYKDRLGYACIFGAMTVQITDVLLPGKATLSGAVVISEKYDDLTSLSLLAPFIKALVLVFNVALIALAFYPLFLCITTDYRFIGSIMGIVCTTYRLVVGLWTVSSCQLVDDYQDYAIIKYSPLFYNAPSLICLVGLNSKYCYSVVKCIRKGRFLMYPKKEVLAEKHHVFHVQRLFGPTPLPWHEKILHSMSIFNPEKLRAKFFYNKTPYFRFPTRLVATFVILIAATYQVELEITFNVWFLIRRLQKEATPISNAWLGPQIADILKKYVGNFERWLQIANDLWIVVTCITFGIMILYLYHAAICYRRHVYRVYRGDKSMFPESWVRQASQNIMTNAVRYAGQQVAFFMWGFVLIQIVLYLVFTIIVYLIIIPAAEFEYYDILKFLATIVIIPTLISMGIFYSQVILARYFFLQPKVNSGDTTVPLAVNNRRAFYNVSLIYFFFNIFLGIISASLRILNGMMLGIFLSPRIDRSVIMRGYEHMDSGFMCYLSVLTVTGAHDHPVVRTFVKILWDGASDRRNTRLPVLDRKSRIARRNWQLAYTLINNPDVIRYRKTITKLEDIDGMELHRIVVAERNKKEGMKTSKLHTHAVECISELQGLDQGSSHDHFALDDGRQLLQQSPPLQPFSDTRVHGSTC